MFRQARDSNAQGSPKSVGEKDFSSQSLFGSANIDLHNHKPLLVRGFVDNSLRWSPHDFFVAWWRCFSFMSNFTVWLWATNCDKRRDLMCARFYAFRLFVHWAHFLTSNIPILLDASCWGTSIHGDNRKRSVNVIISFISSLPRATTNEKYQGCDSSNYIEYSVTWQRDLGGIIACVKSNAIPILTDVSTWTMWIMVTFCFEERTL